jgi:hypothetical protein
MTNDNLANILKTYDYMELQQEQYQGQLSEEEIIRLGWDVKQAFTHKTIEEFAKEYEGDSLSIYYRDGVQRGFVRLSSDLQKQTVVHKTMQSIIFDIDHPDDGLVDFNLNEYRK